MEGQWICKMLFVLSLDVVASHSCKARHDKSVSNCCNTQTEKICGLEHRVTELEKEIAKIYEKDIPLVAFSSYNPIPTGISTNQVIKFNSVPLNEGNAYNSSSGIFSVPVDGLYEFDAHICNIYGRYIVFAIIRDDNTIAVSTQWDDTDSCGSVNALALLKAGENVFVSCIFCQAGAILYENIHRRNSFSGVLLRTDG